MGMFLVLIGVASAFVVLVTAAAYMAENNPCTQDCNQGRKCTCGKSQKD